MSTQVKLPAVGENIESGQVVKVLVKVGDTITVDQPLIELETGKATVEVPSTASGKIVAVLVKQGDTLNVGGAIVELEEEQPAETKRAAEAKPGEAKPASPATLDLTPPPSGPTPPPPPEARAQAAAPQPAAPPSAEARAVEPPPEQPEPAAPPTAKRPGPAIAAPHVRQFAREIGLNIEDVAGSGPGGRISIEDVKRHARDLGGGAPARGGARPIPKLPDFSKYGPIERVPMNAVRRATAHQMDLSWSTIPHVILQSKADVTELENFRVKYKSRADAAGGKLTVTAMLIKVAASGLRAFPGVNASLDLGRQEIVIKKYCHVGFAADTPRGLVVPVVRDADKKSLIEISAELTRLAQKARDGKLGPADIEGASFSVTNLGGFGIGHFSAIINHPEVAILAIGRAANEPAWDGTQFRPRLMLPLTLCIDHRVLDGADGARFLKWVVDAIEQPFLLALES